MKKLLLGVTLICLLAGALAPSVRGEEGENAPAVETWVFDVRVVRVDAATPEAVETPAPWEADGSCTTTTPWPELLKQLKARGKTTLLLDQRITALADLEAVASQTRDRQIQQMQSRDFNNERWQSAPLMTGCTAKLKVAAAVLSYQVEARWEIRADVESVRPLMCTTKWAGTFPVTPAGETLVLTYREQVETWGEDRVGQEIHAFVTARRLPAR